MLSYQHIYHAGNLADVQKHALLAWVLNYLTQKDKPLSYVETHSGRGLYQLDADRSMRTGEAAAGIARAQREGWFGPGHPMARVLKNIQARHGDAAYPGSPMIAAHLLRDQDSLHFAELHPRNMPRCLWQCHRSGRRCIGRTGLSWCNPCCLRRRDGGFC